MSALLEKAVAKIRELPEERQNELAEIMLEMAQDPDAWVATADQLAEIEAAKREAREGKFATDEEMAETWRRFRR
jgi:predicted transcriptional regulator